MATHDTDTPDARKVAEEAHEAANAVGQYDDWYNTDKAAERQKRAEMHLAIDRAILTARIEEHRRACKMPSRCIRYKNLTHELEALR